MWEGLVTTRRNEFNEEFFSYIRYKLEAAVLSTPVEAKRQAAAVAAAEAAAVGKVGRCRLTTSCQRLVSALTAKIS